MVIRRWPCLVGVASLVAFALVGCESDASSATETNAVEVSNGTAKACAIDTAGGADNEIAVTIAGSGQCTDSITATVTVKNRTEGECSSDILGTIQPGNHQMWFASESGYGGASGRWELMPANVVEGVGIILYPEGLKSWPITLPSLSPGEYTFTMSVASCDLGQQQIDIGTAFTVSTTPA